jgi:hypothetical protein
MDQDVLVGLIVFLTVTCMSWGLGFAMGISVGKGLRNARKDIHS